MKFKTFTLLLAVAFVFGAVQANANTLSLSLGDIAGFSMLSSSDAATVTVNNGLIPAGTAVTISTIFSPPQSGVQSANVGLAGLNIGFNAGDAFCLNLENTNENPWSFQLVAETDQGIFMSAAQSLVPDTGANFSAALGGVAGTISSTYFVISANVPFPDGDRTAEYQVSPPRAVPEPATLTLLGMGLAGAGWFNRRRNRKSA